MSTLIEAENLTGREFGAWVVARLDPSGKRALCVCRCGRSQQIAVNSLLSGESVGCGCSTTPRRAHDPPASVSERTRNDFADAGKWHRGGSARS